MTDSYCLLRLRDSGNSTAAIAGQLVNEQMRWRAEGVVVWGIWRGLFGLASNEVLVMLAAEGDRSGDVFSVSAPSVEIVSSDRFVPTARPEAIVPVNKPGIYVFRWFSIAAETADEFVELSTQAWVSFEDAGNYSAQPQGLFRELGEGDEIDMLLVTWYDSLASWQTSRQPAVSASERFRRRHQLTRRTLAVATTLL